MLFSLLLLALFVHVFHFTRSSLFPLVCVSFGSGSRFFCLGRNIFSCMHGFVQDTSYCVCGPGPLGSGAGFRFGTNCFIYGPGPFGSWSRVLFKTKYLAHEVRDLLALGDCSLFGKNFLLVRLREPVFFPFVWSEILLCMWSGTARLRESFCLRSRPAWLREPVLVTYAVRDRFALGAGFIFAKDYCYTA